MLMWDGKRKQIDVARAMGITSDGLGRKLKGERGWALSELVQLAEVLGTSVSYLVGEDAPKGPELRTLVPKVAGSIPVGGTSHEIVSLAERRAERAQLAAVSA